MRVYKRNHFVIGAALGFKRKLKGNRKRNLKLK